MTTPKHFFPQSLSASEVKTVSLLFVFMVLTIFYYFLRFQFGQPRLIAVAQTSLLAYLGFIGVVRLVTGKYRLRHGLDYVFFVLFIHAILFTIYASVRDGIPGITWAGVTFLLPVMIYFYISNVLSPVGASRVLTLLELILTGVAILYIVEFVNFHVLDEGYFTYVRALTARGEETGSDVFMGWVQGEHYTYFRLPGALAHVNTTGVALALGFVMSVYRYISTSKYLSTVPFILLFAVALILSGGRTSILSAAVGALVAIFLVPRKSLARVAPQIGIVALLLIVVLSVLVASNVIDAVAFNVIFNAESVINTGQLSLSMESGSITARYASQIAANPVVLLTGLGPSSPVTPVGDLYLSPIVSGDLFIVSILSRYGVVLPAILAFTVLVTVGSTLRHGKRRDDALLQAVSIRSFACVVALVVSTVHTDAILRPQLSPILTICLATMSVVYKHSWSEGAKGRLGVR